MAPLLLKGFVPALAAPRGVSPSEVSPELSVEPGVPEPEAGVVVLVEPGAELGEVEPGRQEVSSLSSTVIVLLQASSSLASTRDS